MHRARGSPRAATSPALGILSAADLSNLEIGVPVSRDFEDSRTTTTLSNRSLCAAFLHMARRWPERTAVSSGGRSLSYAELERASAALAQDLIQRGASHGSVIGVFLHRSVDLSVATLGILRAGAAYVPLDPEDSHDRLSFIAADAKLSIIVTEAALSERLPGGSRAVLIEQPRSAAAHEIDHSQPSATACVLYTPSSNGMLLRAVIDHQNAASALPDFFLPLTLGASVVIPTLDELSSRSSGIRSSEEASEREEWLL